MWTAKKNVLCPRSTSSASCRFHRWDPYDEVVLPPESQEVDWVVELAVVWKRKASLLKATDAMAQLGFCGLPTCALTGNETLGNGGCWETSTLATGPILGRPRQCWKIQLKVPAPSGPKSSNTNQMVFRQDTDSLGLPVSSSTPGCTPELDPRCRCN